MCVCVCVCVCVFVCVCVCVCVCVEDIKKYTHTKALTGHTNSVYIYYHSFYLLIFLNEWFLLVAYKISFKIKRIKASFDHQYVWKNIKVIICNAFSFSTILGLSRLPCTKAGNYWDHALGSCPGIFSNPE